MFGYDGIGRSYTGDSLPLQIDSNGSVWTYTYNNRRLVERESLVDAGSTYNIDRVASFFAAEEKRRRYLRAVAFSFLAAGLGRASAPTMGLAALLAGAISGRTDRRRASCLSSLPSINSLMTMRSSGSSRVSASKRSRKSSSGPRPGGADAQGKVIPSTFVQTTNNIMGGRNWECKFANLKRNNWTSATFFIFSLQRLLGFSCLIC